MAVPTIDCKIEPLVNGKLVYLAVAPERKGLAASGMVAFELRVKNNQPAPGQGQPKPTLKLKSLQVSFPGSAVPAVSFARNESIAPAATETLYLDEDRDKIEQVREAIRIPADAPATIQIALTFEGFTAWKGTWPLAAHASPTPEGSYGFPFKADDLPEGVFIEPNARHAEGGQHFAYDIHAIKYDFEAETWRDHSDDAGSNEGRYIWGRKVHAVADGIVLHAEDKWEDNARPGDRKLLRGSIIEHGTAEVISIAGNGEDARIFTAVTNAQKRMQLRCFDPSADASSLTFEGESALGLPFAGTELSLASMSTTHTVTAGAAGGAMVLGLWKTSADGATVANSDTVVIAQTESVKIEKLSAGRIVMARQPVGGRFTVSVWDVAGPDDLPPKATATAMTSGPAPLFDIAVLSKTRFVTAVQTAGGKLKVIVWDVALDKDGNVTAITRGKDLDTGDGATQIAAAATSAANQFAVATRTASGKLGLYYFDIAAGGDVGLTANTTGDAVTLVSLILFKRSSMATAVRTADGKLRFTPWSLDDEGVIKPGGQFDDPLGDVTALALTRIGENRAGAAVRTPSGKLKIVIWRATEGNGYTILHGDEVVVYAHMQHDSLPKPLPKPGDKVKKGSVLGKVGNSGPSSGPHLHIHASKVMEDVSDVGKVIERYEAGKLVTAFRPMPFHGVQATLTKHAVDGDNNWFGEVVDQGFYFEPYAIHPAVDGGKVLSAGAQNGRATTRVGARS
jgi:murein DD-endopeptidase MepM/ murein hydrolase activator NlpD